MMHKTMFDLLGPGPVGSGSLRDLSMREMEEIDAWAAEQTRILDEGTAAPRARVSAGAVVLGGLGAWTAFELMADSAPLEPIPYEPVEGDMPLAGATAFDAMPESIPAAEAAIVEAVPAAGHGFEAPPPVDPGGAASLPDMEAPVGHVSDIHRVDMPGAGNDAYLNEGGSFFDAGSGFTYIPGEGIAY